MWPVEQRVREPDPANPVVIRMWKLRRAEELIDLEHWYGVPPSEKVVFLDFLAGRTSTESGDLKLVITRGHGNRPEDPSFPWSVRLEPVNGGIIKVTDTEFHRTYEAPAAGYEPFHEFDISEQRKRPKKSRFREVADTIDTTGSFSPPRKGVSRPRFLRKKIPSNSKAILWANKINAESSGKLNEIGAGFGRVENRTQTRVLKRVPIRSLKIVGENEGPFWRRF
jgi:hypothetical protein